MSDEEGNTFKRGYEKVLIAAIKDCLWGNGEMHAILVLGNSKSSQACVYALNSTPRQVGELLVAATESVLIQNEDAGTNAAMGNIH